jgi:glycosyltransferase involved in cell wall biosynthesis
MKLSAVVGTKNSAARLPALIERLGELADEVVVLVDSTTSDATAEVAEHLGAKVYSFVHDEHLLEMRRQMFERCTGE